MSSYTVTIEGGPITIHVSGAGVRNEDEAYIEGCNQIREAIRSLKGAFQISPHYRKPGKVEYHGDPDPRD